jgi:Helix-turn-helix domain
VKSRVIVWRDCICDDDALTALQRLVGFVLAQSMDAGGFCWVSHRTIHERANLSMRAVEKALDELEQRGFLFIDPPKRFISDRNGREYWRRPGGAGAKNNNRYQAQLPPSANPVRTSEWERATKERTRRPKRANERPEKSEPRSYEQAESVEHSAAHAPNGRTALQKTWELRCGGCGLYFVTGDEEETRCEDCRPKVAA